MKLKAKKEKKNKKESLKTIDKILIPLFSIIIVVSLLCVAGVVLLNTSFLKNSESVGEDGIIDSDVQTPVEVKHKYVNFLVAGIDYLEGSGRGKLTDVIMVVSFDIEGKNIDILQIPRDTFIGTDYPTGKINAIYGQKNNGGIEGLANRINKTLNLSIDHYITITMDGFVSAVDKIGGVPVDVPKKIALEGVTINPGMQILNGRTAEKFVRERHSYANQDLGRLEMQRVFMKAMIEKIFSMGKTKIASLVPSLIKDVTTDLTISQVLGYYDDLMKVDRQSAINFHLLPITSGGMNGKVSVLSIKKKETAEMLNEYFRPHTDAVSADDLGAIELVTNYKKNSSTPE